jgi:hypothetical protein
MWDADLTFAEIGYDAVPGLWEGFLEGEANLTDPNPRTDIKLGTVAAQTSSSAIWGTYRTGVYTGTIWNREDHDVTWTFAKNFDDTAHVYIDGTLRALSANSWSAIGLVTVTLTPGPHAFEVRYGDNGGNIGPSGSITAGGIGGLAYDPLGRGPSSEQANFLLLEDSGDGSVLSLTADAFGYACDVITSAGALDLTGLTVMPSDAQSAEPPGREYVILRAEGGLTGTAVCEGFTNKKWMVLKRGNDLLLTTAGGSIMVLK